MPYANNKGAVQPARIGAFVGRCLDNMIPLVSISEIQASLPSFCDCTDRFESILVVNPEDRFSRGEAQMDLVLSSEVHQKNRRATSRENQFWGLRLGKTGLLSYRS